MNADELFEIVKDVPREAWPKFLFYHDYQYPHIWKWIPPLEETDRGLGRNTEEAALMFEASMARWLIGEGFHSFEWGNAESPLVTLDLYDHHFENRSERDSLIKLLAIACKAVKP
jgi:hypothetical protein